jgi:hypothetical protein
LLILFQYCGVFFTLWEDVYLFSNCHKRSKLQCNTY